MMMEVLHGDCLQVMQGMTSRSVAMVLFSPPYALKTERYDGSRKKMTWPEWVSWQASVIAEANRVSAGFVIVNANNPVRDGEMIPANEYLIAKLHGEFGIKCERPVIWHKNACSNCRPWWVNDWEPVMAFYSGDRPTVWNWESIASAPKYSKGGAYRQRDSKGNRKLGNANPDSKLARPRDVLRVTVGGGHMGSPLAHENEAPFPERLVEPFILALTNPGDLVLDPFCGSGTTLAVAIKNQRRAIGIDIRLSQVALSNRRLSTLCAVVQHRCTTAVEGT